MNNIFKYLLFFYCNFSLNALQASPSPFLVGEKKAVCVDFEVAEYKITYDIQKKLALATSKIIFHMPEEGYPLFDVVSKPVETRLNDQLVFQNEVDLPHKASKMRLIDKKIKPGQHSLVVQTIIKDNIFFDKTSVNNQFSYLDMQDRSFLEKYLPTNLEFDRYKIQITVSVTGTTTPHSVFSNGIVKKKPNNHFYISYPQYFTSSSLYFHIAPTLAHNVKQFSFKSMNGKKVLVTIYSKKGTGFLTSFFKMRVMGWFFARGKLNKLEQKFGPWPHPTLTIFAKNSLRGGMEYAGAVESSHSALEHELLHNYFGRSIMPMNGSAGWIDEAIASWYDWILVIERNIKTLKIKSFGKSLTEQQIQDVYLKNLSEDSFLSHHEFRRSTDRKAYKQGRYLLAYLGYLMKKKSNGKKVMRDFLRYFYEKRKFSMIKDTDLQADLEEYSGLNFSEEFNKYVYNQSQ